MRPSAGNTVYAATKCFATYLSKGLGFELREKIDFLAISPGPVSTEMTKNMTVNFTTKSSEAVVRTGLRDLGRDEETCGTLGHDYFAWMKVNYYSNATMYRNTLNWGKGMMAKN